MSVGAEPPISAATNSCISVNPPMSVRTAFGASHDAHGSRGMIEGDTSLDLMSLRICC